MSGVSFEFDNVQPFLDFVEPKVLARLNKTATNRTANQAATEISKAVRDKSTGFNVQAALVKRALRRSFEANGVVHTQHINYTGRRLGLEHYQAKSKKITLRGKKTRFGDERRGVTVKIRHGRSRRLVKGAFLAQVKNGQVFVFKREGSGRLPIERLKTISIPEMVRMRRVIKRVQGKVDAVYPKELNRLLVKELNR